MSLLEFLQRLAALVPRPRRHHPTRTHYGSGGFGGRPIPDPATVALLALGLVGLGFSRRKQA